MVAERAPRPLRAVLGGRGVPDMVRRTRLVEAVAEGKAFSDAVVREAAGIQVLGATGNRTQVVNAAGRLGAMAQTYGREFQRLAGDVEE